MMNDIIKIQTYLNSIVNINNDCIATYWWIMIGFNQLISKENFQASDKISLFEDYEYEKFYIISESGEKIFIGDYVELQNWREELRKTCDSYFFGGVFDLLSKVVRKISDIDTKGLCDVYYSTMKTKKSSTDKFLQLIDEFFKDKLVGVYLKGEIDSKVNKRPGPIEEFIFKSDEGIFILKFEMGD